MKPHQHHPYRNASRHGSSNTTSAASSAPASDNSSSSTGKMKSTPRPIQPKPVSVTRLASAAMPSASALQQHQRHHSINSSPSAGPFRRLESAEISLGVAAYQDGISYSPTNLYHIPSMAGSLAVHGGVGLSLRQNETPTSDLSNTSANDFLTTAITAPIADDELDAFLQSPYGIADFNETYESLAIFGIPDDDIDSSVLGIASSRSSSSTATYQDDCIAIGVEQEKLFSHTLGDLSYVNTTAAAPTNQSVSGPSRLGAANFADGIPTGIAPNLVLNDSNGSTPINSDAELTDELRDIAIFHAEHLRACRHIRNNIPREFSAGGEKLRRYYCWIPDCEGRYYRNQNGLKYHLSRFHTAEQRELHNALEKLVRNDPNIKQYICRYPDCGKRYRNANGLVYHLKTAHNEDPEIARSNAVLQHTRQRRASQESD